MTPYPKQLSCLRVHSMSQVQPAIRTPPMHPVPKPLLKGRDVCLHAQVYMKRNEDWRDEVVKAHKKARENDEKTRGFLFVTQWQKYIDHGMEKEEAYKKVPSPPLNQFLFPSLPSTNVLALLLLLLPLSSAPFSKSHIPTPLSSRWTRSSRLLSARRQKRLWTRNWSC